LIQAAGLASAPMRSVVAAHRIRRSVDEAIVEPTSAVAEVP
jgi:hypothetical protein